MYWIDDEENSTNIRGSQQNNSVLSLWNVIIPKINLAKNIVFSAVGDLLERQNVEIHAGERNGLKQTLSWKNTEKSVWTLRSVERRKGSLSNLYINPSLLHDILALDKELSGVLDDLHLNKDELNRQLLQQFITRSNQKLALVAPRKNNTFSLGTSPTTSLRSGRKVSTQTLKPEADESSPTISLSSDDTMSLDKSDEDELPMEKKNNLVVKCNYNSCPHSSTKNIVNVFRHDSMHQIPPLVKFSKKCSHSDCRKKAIEQEIQRKKSKDEGKKAKKEKEDKKIKEEKFYCKCSLSNESLTSVPKKTKWKRSKTNNSYSHEEKKKEKKKKMKTKKSGPSNSHSRKSKTRSKTKMNGSEEDTATGQVKMRSESSQSSCSLPICRYQTTGSQASPSRIRYRDDRQTRPSSERRSRFSRMMVCMPVGEQRERTTNNSIRNCRLCPACNNKPYNQPCPVCRHFSGMMCEPKTTGANIVKEFNFPLMNFSQGTRKVAWCIDASPSCIPLTSKMSQSNVRGGLQIRVIPDEQKIKRCKTQKSCCTTLDPLYVRSGTLRSKARNRQVTFSDRSCDPYDTRDMNPCDRCNRRPCECPSEPPHFQEQPSTHTNSHEQASVTQPYNQSTCSPQCTLCNDTPRRSKQSRHHKSQSQSRELCRTCSSPDRCRSRSSLLESFTPQYYSRPPTPPSPASPLTSQPCPMACTSQNNSDAPESSRQYPRQSPSGPCTPQSCPRYHTPQPVSEPCTPQSCPKYRTSQPLIEPCTPESCPKYQTPPSLLEPCTTQSCTRYHASQASLDPCTPESCPKYHKQRTPPGTRTPESRQGNHIAQPRIEPCNSETCTKYGSSLPHSEASHLPPCSCTAEPHSRPATPERYSEPYPKSRSRQYIPNSKPRTPSTICNQPPYISEPRAVPQYDWHTDRNENTRCPLMCMSRTRSQLAGDKNSACSMRHSRKKPCICDSDSKIGLWSCFASKRKRRDRERASRSRNSRGYVPEQPDQCNQCINNIFGQRENSDSRPAYYPPSRPNLISRHMGYKQRSDVDSSSFPQATFLPELYDSSYSESADECYPVSYPCTPSCNVSPASSMRDTCYLRRKHDKPGWAPRFPYEDPLPSRSRPPPPSNYSLDDVKPAGQLRDCDCDYGPHNRGQYGSEEGVFYKPNQTRDFASIPCPNNVPRPRPHVPPSFDPMLYAPAPGSAPPPTSYPPPCYPPYPPTGLPYSLYPPPGASSYYAPRFPPPCYPHGPPPSLHYAQYPNFPESGAPSMSYGSISSAGPQPGAQFRGDLTYEPMAYRPNAPPLRKRFKEACVCPPNQKKASKPWLNRPWGRRGPYARGNPRATGGFLNLPRHTGGPTSRVSPVQSGNSVRYPRPQTPSGSIYGSNCWPQPAPNFPGSYPSEPNHWPSYYPQYGCYQSCYPAQMYTKFSCFPFLPQVRISGAPGRSKYSNSKTSSEGSTSSCSSTESYSWESSSRSSSSPTSTTTTMATPSYCVANCRNTVHCQESSSCSSICSSRDSRKKRRSRTKRSFFLRRTPNASDISDQSQVSDPQIPCRLPVDDRRSQVCSSAANVHDDSKSRFNKITHYNERIKFELQKIGMGQLIEASRPAKCCKQTILNEPSKDELPYTASLASLPLDRADIRVIRQSVRMVSRKKEINLKSLENRTKLVYYANLMTDDFDSRKPSVEPQYEVRYFYYTLDDADTAHNSTKRTVDSTNMFKFFQIFNWSEERPTERFRLQQNPRAPIDLTSNLTFKRFTSPIKGHSRTVVTPSIQKNKNILQNAFFSDPISKRKSEAGDSLDGDLVTMKLQSRLNPGVAQISNDNVAKLGDLVDCRFTADSIFNYDTTIRDSFPKKTNAYSQTHLNAANFPWDKKSCECASQTECYFNIKNIDKFSQEFLKLVSNSKHASLEYLMKNTSHFIFDSEKSLEADSLENALKSSINPTGNKFVTHSPNLKDNKLEEPDLRLQDAIMTMLGEVRQLAMTKNPPKSTNSNPYCRDLNSTVQCTTSEDYSAHNIMPPKRPLPYNLPVLKQSAIKSANDKDKHGSKEEFVVEVYDTIDKMIKQVYSEAKDLMILRENRMSILGERVSNKSRRYSPQKQKSGEISSTANNDKVSEQNELFKSKERKSDIEKHIAEVSGGLREKLLKKVMKVLKSNTFKTFCRQFDTVYTSGGKIITKFYNFEGQVLNGIYDSYGKLLTNQTTSGRELACALFDDEGNLLPARYDSKGNILKEIYDSQKKLLVKIYNSEKLLMKLPSENWNRKDNEQICNANGYPVQQFYTQEGNLLTSVYDFKGNLIRGTFLGDVSLLFPRIFDGQGKFILGRYTAKGDMIKGVFDSHGYNLQQLYKPDKTVLQKLPMLFKIVNQNGDPIHKFYSKNKIPVKHVYDVLGNLLCQASDGNAKDLLCRLFDLDGYFILGRLDESRHQMEAVYDHKGNKILKVQVLENDMDNINRISRLYNSKGQILVNLFDEYGVCLNEIHDAKGTLVESSFTGRAIKLAGRIFDMAGYFINGRYDSQKNLIKKIYDHEGNKVLQIYDVDGKVVRRTLQPEKIYTYNGKHIKHFFTFDGMVLSSIHDTNGNMIDGIYSNNAEELAPYLFDIESNFINSRYDSRMLIIEHVYDSKSNILNRIYTKSNLSPKQLKSYKDKAKSVKTVYVKLDCKDVKSNKFKYGTISPFGNLSRYQLRPPSAIDQKIHKKPSNLTGFPHRKAKEAEYNFEAGRQLSSAKSQNRRRENRDSKKNQQRVETPRAVVSRPHGQKRSALVLRSPSTHLNRKAKSPKREIEEPLKTKDVPSQLSQDETDVKKGTEVISESSHETTTNTKSEIPAEDAFLCNLPNAPPFILKMNKVTTERKHMQDSRENYFNKNFDSISTCRDNSMDSDIRFSTSISSSYGCKCSGYIKIPNSDLLIDKTCPSMKSSYFKEFVTRSITLIRNKRKGKLKIPGCFMSSPTVCMTGLTGVSNNPFRVHETDSGGHPRNSSFISTDVLFKKNSFCCHSKIPRMLHPAKCKVHDKMKNVQLSCAKGCAASRGKTAPKCQGSCPNEKLDSQVIPHVNITVSTTCPSKTNTSVSGNLKAVTQAKSRNANVQTPTSNSSVGDCVKGVKSDPGCYCGKPAVETMPCPVRLKEVFAYTEEDEPEPEPEEDAALCFCPPGEQPLLMKKSNIECDCANKNRCEDDKLIEPPIDKPDVFWALTKVSLMKDGTKHFEIIDVSPVPPGYYLMPDVNNLVLVGPQPKPAKATPTKQCSCK